METINVEPNMKFSIHGQMISGQGEQAARSYKKIIGNKNVWYIAIQENSADNIYCTPIVPDTQPSSGFGGAILSFKLEDGTIEKVQGPWHANPDSLFMDANYDIRDKCFSQGIIAKNKKPDYLNGDEFIDVLHYDEHPVIGIYDRIKNIAQKFANDLNCEICYSVKTSGGGSSSWVKPINKTNMMFNRRTE